MVKTNKNQIFCRIYYKKVNEIDKHSTRQALIPSSIHCYDASVMHCVIKICLEINLNLLVIHDSIGCEALLAPIMKIIFKVSNLYILDKNEGKIIFPFANVKKTDEKTRQYLIENILKSKDFFR